MAETWLKHGEYMAKTWGIYGEIMGKTWLLIAIYGPYMAAMFFLNFGHGHGGGSPCNGPYMAIHVMDF